MNGLLLGMNDAFIAVFLQKKNLLLWNAVWLTVDFDG